MARNKTRNANRQHPLQRKVNVREPIPRFLIVCEGARTEPNYFKMFKVPKEIAIVEVEGIGFNTKSLVQAAVERKSGEVFDQVWCVFDRDSFTTAQFNEAIQLANRRGIHVAYSNEAFELWYLLHFDFVNTGQTRDQYITKLEERMGVRYAKNSRGMYELLHDKLPIAMKNAERLFAACDRRSPAEDNPSTTVHLLVNELLKFSR